MLQHTNARVYTHDTVDQCWSIHPCQQRILNLGNSEPNTTPRPERTFTPSPEQMLHSDQSRVDLTPMPVDLIYPRRGPYSHVTAILTLGSVDIDIRLDLTPILMDFTPIPMDLTHVTANLLLMSQHKSDLTPSLRPTLRSCRNRPHAYVTADPTTTSQHTSNPWHSLAVTDLTPM